MQSPTGSVVALSSAASTMFSIGIFLGYWGLHEPSVWRVGDRVVAGLALAGFACLGSVPWLATSPAKPNDESRFLMARRAFLCGAAAVWVAIALSLVL
ncbi:MAG TPA: hypothetical protein VMJ11_08865 [Paraburkholderia sp.]|uniref:hypothetical protein n=1 Tax=Paraburkholderia sp. TaxID=1926495 RepID=UPI002B50CCF9|nr:hypothetical protein [Paraburkholderia sp.]HTR06751.1 hypothetical protein [Paraburkholderia sp.]